MSDAKKFHDAFPKLPHTFRYGSFMVTVKAVSTDGKNLWQIDDIEASYLGIPITIPPHWLPMGWVNFQFDPKDHYQIPKLICNELRTLV